jgi:type I restriction enzyme, S subunit
MINFTKIKLGDVGDVTTGRTPNTSDAENYGSEYMFLGPTDLHKHFIVTKSEKYITAKGLASINSSVIDGFSICVGCIGWDMGNVAIVNEKCATNQQINSITKIKDEYNSYYIYYWLKSKKDFLFRQANVTRTPILNKTNFSNIDIWLPGKSQQDKIANILSTIDEKIEVNNKICAKLDAMAKLIYDYWFVQFDFPDEHGKPYKSSGGKMLYNEELKREIPDGWVVEGLTKAMEVQYGFPFSTKLFNEEKAGLPVVRIRNLLDTSITMYSTESVDQKYLIKKGDLLVGMDGNFHMNFWDKEGCYLNQRCVRIRSRAGSTVTNFQAFFQISPYIKAREKNVSRTTVGHLSAKDIDDLYVLIPCSNNLLCKTSYFDSMLEKIITHRNESQKLAELRDWLLPMLMNGQVTVE